MNTAFAFLVMVLCVKSRMANFPLSNEKVSVFSQVKKIYEDFDVTKRRSSKNDNVNETVYSEPEDTKYLELFKANKFRSSEEIKSSDKFKSAQEVKVSVDTSHEVNVIEDFFLSFTIDSYILQPDVHWLKFNFSSPKIYTLLTALSPALLRVGGSPADWLFFNKPFQILDRLHLKPAAIVMTKTDIINLVTLTSATGNRLLFDLNLQLRFGLQWDPSNAIELLQFCSYMGFGDNMDWELGNEPEYNSAIGQTVLTPEQIGHDFVLLRKLLQSYPNMAKSMIVGPDIVDTSFGSAGLKIIEQVANMSGGFLKAITFHHYYFRGDNATYKDYLNPDYFASLDTCIRNVLDTISHSKYPDVPCWLGETSDSWHSGTENVSDRFVSGFLWMDKLGLAAKIGAKVVMRQTLYGHFYALLDINMDPNPDFWLSWVYRLLVGKQVLSVSLSGSMNSSTAQTTRIYAHCTNRKSALYKPGSVTVFGLNVNQDASVSLTFTGGLSAHGIDLYLLEPDGPDGVLSRWVKLNGKRLAMPSDFTMPDAKPVRLPPDSKVLLPPLTFGFFVFPDISIDICN